MELNTSNESIAFSTGEAMEDDWFDVPLDNNFVPEIDYLPKSGKNDESQAKIKLKDSASSVLIYGSSDETSPASLSFESEKPVLAKRRKLLKVKVEQAPSDSESEAWGTRAQEIIAHETERRQSLPLERVESPEAFKTPERFWKKRFSEDFWEKWDIHPNGRVKGSSENCSTETRAKSVGYQEREIIDPARNSISALACPLKRSTWNGPKRHFKNHRKHSSGWNNNDEILVLGIIPPIPEALEGAVSDIETESKDASCFHLRKESCKDKIKRKEIKDEYFRDQKNGSEIGKLQRKRKMVAGEERETDDNESWTDSIAELPIKRGNMGQAQKRNSKGMRALHLDRRMDAVRRKQFDERLGKRLIEERCEASPTVLEIYLDLLYYSGLSPFKRNRKPIGEMRFWEIFFFIFQLLAYGFSASLAALKGILKFKDILLAFLENREPQLLFDVGNLCVSSMMRLYAIYFLLNSNSTLSPMFDKWQEYDAYTNATQSFRSKVEKNKRKKMLYKLAILIFIGTFGVLFVQNCMETVSNEWTAKNLLIQNAADLAIQLEVWSPGAKNQTERIYDRFERNVPTIWTYSFGMVGWSMEFFNNLQLDIIQSIMLLTCLVHDEHIQQLSEKVMEAVLSKPPLEFQIENNLRCWRHYRLAKKVNKITNDTIEKLLVYSLANNFFLLTVLATFFLDKNVKFINYLFIAYRLVKPMYTFWIARKSEKYNEKIQQWIKSLQCFTQRFMVGCVHYTRSVMLHELQKEPFGLGSGAFRITKKFMWKGVVAVGSMVGTLIASNYILTQPQGDTN